MDIFGQTRFTGIDSHLPHLFFEKLQIKRHALTIADLRANEDFSALEKESVSDLPQSKLSKMSVNFVVARSDACSLSYDVCFVPCMEGKSDKTSMFFRIMGQILLGFTQAAGKPPQGYAFDGGTPNSKLACAALGILPESEMTGPFWSNCQVERLNFAMMPFGVLKYKGYPILGSLDCLHTLKRFTIQHSAGCRTIRWGALFVEMRGMMMNGMPLPSYVVRDSQSDVESFNRLNPRFLKPSWESAGCFVQCLVASLLSSCWASWLQDSVETIITYHYYFLSDFYPCCISFPLLEYKLLCLHSNAANFPPAAGRFFWHQQKHSMQQRSSSLLSNPAQRSPSCAEAWIYLGRAFHA